MTIFVFAALVVILLSTQQRFKPVLFAPSTTTSQSEQGAGFTTEPQSENNPGLIEVIKEILPITERNTTPRAQCDRNELTGTEICCSDGQKIYYTFTGASDVPTGCFTPAKDVGTTCLQPHDCDSGQCILSLEEFYQYRQSGACKKNGIATHSCPDISGVCSEGRVEGGVFFISPGIIEQEILD